MYRTYLSLLLIFLLSQCKLTDKTENPDYADLGENAYLFSPEMEMGTIQHLIDSIYAIQTTNESEFNENRIAFLFQPGEYKLDVKVGYYTHVIGLGQSPNDVTINGSVTAVAPPTYNGSVLINFWRAVENLTINPSIDSTNVWGVSQAAPMRRVHVKGNLQLHDNGAASGGFLADSKVDGQVVFGGQQQWFSRNSEWESCTGGLWNMVSLGVVGAPEADWPAKPYLSINETPFVREKPFWTMNDAGEMWLEVPVLKEKTKGVSWESEENGNNTKINSSEFYIANPKVDNAESINAALAQGKNILFTPGIYWLKNSIEVKKPGTILIGMGMPSLIPEGENPVIKIADVDNVTLSSILIDAGLFKTDQLIQIGEPGADSDHSENPTFIYDLFIRVGGFHAGTTRNCVTINSNNVVVDHVWLWRADHGNGVGWDINKAANGLTVNGKNVTIYGLFNEHFQEYQTIWNGENGTVYFYQCEMPYYVPSPEAWQHDGKNGYASYKVADHVTNHQAWGLGIYNVFFNSAALVDYAIEAPQNLEQNFHQATTIWLGGNEGSEVKSIINGKGAAVNKGNRKATW
ncbi:coagulation factor 5/8 type domain-containing protein [Draconibacterium sp. IB214405]|uniref:coagulation factor 5/8 type domain-containing protein n=1 Tax=Draconibacterium sp. IB214405 TaxID=3097352 RepID=UPI002A0E9729|nr:coagulation factor 5/8 type domain-containing protein [Draconibacterium sp. IB214405]MDX8337747.1 coagulation factor 5/8 type domain-containing protein [Draconibacterium sp. IB214405]